MAKVTIDKLYDIDDSTYKVENIILLPTAEAAEIYLEKLFDLNTRCFIASADRKYPLDPDLNKKLFYNLENDPKVKLVIFGVTSYNKVKIVTERILLMDWYLLFDYPKKEFRSDMYFNMNEDKIIHMIKFFFNQWGLLSRGTNETDYYYSNYVNESNKDNWQIKLIRDK